MHKDIDFGAFGDPIIVVSHPRSGTHLTLDLLRRQFIACKASKLPMEPNHYLYLSIEGFLEHREDKRLSEERAVKIVKKMERPLIKFHTYSYALLKEKFPHWMDWIEKRGKFIFVVRNYVYVLSSYYLFAQSFEPGANVPISEFIRQPYCGRANRPAYWNEVVLEWQKRKDVLTIRYEDLTKDTEKTLAFISEFINETPLRNYPLLPGQVKSLWMQRLHRLISIQPSSTAILAETNINIKPVLTEADHEFILENASEAMAYYNYGKGPEV